MATPPPTHRPDEILAELDAAERGFVLGVLLSGDGGDEAAATAATLESPSRERCAGVLAAMAGLGRAQRVMLTGHLAHDVVPAFPAGIEAVERSFLRAVFDGEPPAIVGLVARDAPAALRVAAAASLAARAEPPDEGPTPTALSASTAPEPDVSPDLVSELRRAVLADVVTVPPAPEDAPVRSWSRTLATLAPADLLARVTGRGAEVLGLSLRGGGGEVLLRTAALVGAPFAERLLAVGRGGPEEEPDLDLDRDRARGLVAATRPAADPRETLARIGARAVGARLVSPAERGLGGIDAAAAVGQRLPPAIAAEVLAGAHGPTARPGPGAGGRGQA